MPVINGRTAVATDAQTVGIYKVTDVLQEVMEVQNRGLDPGDPPGKDWQKFSYRYRVKRGMMTIVTGMPSSGKSEFMDAIFVNLARECGWKFAVFSPENYPISLHVIKLAEKYAGKPMKDPLIPSRQMTAREADVSVSFINQHFTWIYPDSEKEQVTLDLILQKALAIHRVDGLDGLIIDPWNELESNRGSLSETDFISESLTKIRRWARKHNVHVWIVAHPTKLQKNKQGEYDPPTPYDISGSSNWRNKADFCLCVHRPDLMKPLVWIIIQKVKFKHLGRLGRVDFEFYSPAGTYSETGEAV